MGAFSDAIAEIENTVGEVDATLTTDIGTFLNRAQRKVARARAWAELRTQGWILTVAPYSTGTVATNGTTTVTLTGGTFPAAVASAKYRFALGYGTPWYEVATRSSDTVVLLAQAYVSTDVTASAFVVYKVHYSLPSDCETVEILRVHDHPMGSVQPLDEVTPGMMGWWQDDLPRMAEAPLRYSHVEPLSDGTKQIRVGPGAPDRVYRMEVIYRKIPTTMVVSSQEAFTLASDVQPVVIQLAKAMAYERDHPQKYRMAMDEYRRMLVEVWEESRESDGTGFQIGQGRVFGTPHSGVPGMRVNWGGLELP